MLEIKNYLWSLFTLIIVLRISKENSPKEIQDEGTTMVRNDGNCSATYTASRPKEPRFYFNCMVLFILLKMVCWLLYGTLWVSLDVLDLQQLHLWCFVSQITMKTYKYSKV